MADKKQIPAPDEQHIARIVFFAAVTLCGIIARIMLFPQSSWDMEHFLIPWYEQLRDGGGFRAVGLEIGDYTPMYRYFLAFLTELHIPAVAGIKVFSGIFELVAAVYIMRITALAYPGTHRPLIAYAAAFCLPSVVLNSAGWGQCDGIYTCFLVMSLYDLLKEKDLTAMVMFGISFSFKLQAIFFAPFVLVMVLRRKVRFRTLFAIPAVYFVSIIPSWIAGGSLINLLTIYFRQAGQYALLYMALPNVWSLLPEIRNNAAGAAGVFLAGAGALAYVYYCYMTQGGKDEKLSVTETAASAVFSCYAVPYLLPYMHERYFFAADLMLILVAVCLPEKLWLLPVSQFCAVIATAGNLFDVPRPDMRWVTLAETAVIFTVFMVMRGQRRQNGASPQSENRRDLS